MIEFNFKSQICTTREQSERLLALGLKKETADMTWKFSYLMKGIPQYDCLAESTWDEETIARYVEHCGWMNLTEHWKHPDGTQMSSEEVYAEITKKDIPAWSLHRLIEMMPKCVMAHSIGDDSPRLHPYVPKFDYQGVTIENIDEILADFYERTDLFDNIIDCIAWLIKEGYLTKYLQHSENTREEGR